jgi:hypothetical protein
MRAFNHGTQMTMLKWQPFKAELEMIRQRTLKTIVRTTGVGLHGGRKVHMVLRPAAPDTGIVFHRVDLDPPVSMQADPYAVCDTRMCSGLQHSAGAKVGTVEHLMSALAGLGIDNLHVDVDAPELPILDGSSAPFVFLLRSAGLEVQSSPKRSMAPQPGSASTLPSNPMKGMYREPEPSASCRTWSSCAPTDWPWAEAWAMRS